MARKTLIGIPNDKKRVDVQIGDHVVVTDHPEANGGENTGPSMGAAFLAGVVACTTSTARGYCKKHDLPMPEKVIASVDFDDEKGVVSNVSFEIVVPADFPEKRYKALVKAAGHCDVKRWWLNPPTFETKTVAAE